MATPVVPRDAASLIIHRSAPRGIEVLMGRRHKNARFQPDVYVFPGGMVERCDYISTPASQLEKAITDKLAVAGSHRRAQALAMAAVRETFEETGLLPGVTGEIGPSRDPSWAHFRAHKLAPNLSDFGYLGRAVTPTHQPIRFHARFFFVDSRFVRGQVADSDELEDLQWIALQDCAELNLMQVTTFMLDTLAQRLRGELVRMPFLSFQRGRPRTVWQ